MTNNDSNDLLLGLKNGNEKIISSLFDKVFPNVKNFILKNKGTVEDAKEIFQEALYQLAVKLNTSNIVIKTSFEGYLFTICKNLWRKELNVRNKWVRNEHFFTQDIEETNQIHLSISEEKWKLFENKLQELSDNCKELLKDYFKKTSYREIVVKFDYSTENVAFQRVFKCKKRLTELIKKDPMYSNLTNT